jgi:hypothetical protein
MVDQALYHVVQNPVPPFAMEIQTGSTNNHISQIFFVFSAPMYWWDWLAAPVLMVRYKGGLDKTMDEQGEGARASGWGAS